MPRAPGAAGGGDALPLATDERADVLVTPGDGVLPPAAREPDEVLDLRLSGGKSGYTWMLHCHNRYHAEAGMMTTLVAG